MMLFLFVLLWQKVFLPALQRNQKTVQRAGASDCKEWPQRSVGSAGVLFFGCKASCARRCATSGKKLLAGRLFQTGKGLQQHARKARKESYLRKYLKGLLAVIRVCHD